MLVAAVVFLVVALSVLAGCREEPAEGDLTVLRRDSTEVAVAPGTAASRSATAVRRPPALSGTRAARRTPVVSPMRSSGCGKPFARGETVGEIQWGEGVRTYLLHVPAGYDPRRAASVVLNFHGYAQTAEQQEAYSGLVPLADAKGFVLVTPEGSGSPRGWAISGVYDDNGVDDVGFVSQLVSQLSDSLCLDARRIYATGHSNGAEMASQLACYLPSIIAAAAPVSGAVFQDCQGAGVPIIAFQGTDDWNVPYEDSAGAVAQWVTHNGCPAEPDVSAPAAGVELRSWKCTNGDVAFYVLDGVGHVWPGGDPNRGGVGQASDAVNASAVMWEFFRSHPKR